MSARETARTGLRGQPGLPAEARSPGGGGRGKERRPAGAASVTARRSPSTPAGGRRATARPGSPPSSLEIRGAVTPAAETVLTPGALSFLEQLAAAFAPRLEGLLQQRRERQASIDAGERPRFLEDTRPRRETSWRIAPLPRDLRDRRVEITGPPGAKGILNALNSGASVYMADFEDACAPTWQGLVDGQLHLRAAVAGTLRHFDPESGRTYELGPRPATLMVRPRGLHLPERHVEADGAPVPAALFDFALFFFHNARALLDAGRTPAFYLPKLESHREARWWNDVFVAAERALGIPRGTVKATVLIETLPAAFEMDEILFELREHSAGLNCGRWDYIFSFIKTLRRDPGAVLPDRAELTMEQPFLRAYARLLVRTCHRRGAPAIGGMAAQIPVKSDPERNRAALEKVRADKVREARDGFDGTWVAHPGLVPVAMAIFKAAGGRPPRSRACGDPAGAAGRAGGDASPGGGEAPGPSDERALAEDLLRVPAGLRTESGLRRNVRVALQYLDAWLGGQGCVPLDHLMEDAATAEICRAQVWQWRRHGARLQDGRPVTAGLVSRVIEEEVRELRSRADTVRPRPGTIDRARSIFETLVLSDAFTEFLTLPAYEHLIADPRGGPMIESRPQPKSQLRRLPSVPGEGAPRSAPTNGSAASSNGKSAASNGKSASSNGKASPANGTPAVARPKGSAARSNGRSALAHGSPELAGAKAPGSAPSARWEGIARPYAAADVERLRGSVRIEHTLAQMGSRRLWELLTTRDLVRALGALTGNQAMQQVRAGLDAIYVSGWQVAADANSQGSTYPDQSLYPVDSVPRLVRRINQALLRADQIDHAEGSATRHWLAPLIADAEAGFGGPLNAFELMKAMIEAGAAGVHFEDQLSSEKKCGHLGGKVLVPTGQFIRTLVAARLAADVMDVPAVLIARTDADSAKLLTSDVDPRDREFLTGERTPEGFFRLRGGLECAIARAIAYAPYADLLWCETSKPSIEEARRFAEGVHARYPGKMLAYNCSPSFNWRKHLDDAAIARFQNELAAMGYRFQFVTLAGFHSLNLGMFDLARRYRESGMAAYSELQQAEFDAEALGYTATRHQREVGTGYFDEVAKVISAGAASTLALDESTETEQFS